MMRHLDLFSGIGGFALGLARTNGFETVAFCDSDPKTHLVLKKNFPGVPIFSDVKTLKGEDVGTIDIVTGGFPCQDLSVAGKGKGLAGERSGLWFEMHRIIKETQPKWVIAENVSVLRSRGLDQVLRSLDEIGYDAEWHCIPASHCGASHSRDRIWILAYRRSERGERLEPLGSLSQGGQGGWGGQEDLQQVYASPFTRKTDRWPEPLLCRMDVPLPRRLDRLKQVGNSVYWPIVEQLGYHLHKNLSNK
jgi:DNA (cytosine-5)-methyltransferase 1